MLLYFYVRKGVLYMSTFGMVEKGFYRSVEPVAVVSISNTDALRKAFRDAIARGNPKVPSLPRAKWPQPPVLLKHAGFKTWSAFERGASYWSIKEENGIFHILAMKKKDIGRGWEDDAERGESFPAGTTADEVIERMIAILQNAARENSSR